jgi:hypothetical protein
MPRKLTTKEFIASARVIHGNKYDYSKAEYKNYNTNICIICPTHGEFDQLPYNHTKQKSGCPRCSKNKRLTTKEFIIRANEIHNGKYDYSKVNYINNRTKIIIICPIHGAFIQSPDIHISSPNYCGCPKCGGTIKSNNNQFILAARNVHDNKYNYSLVHYNTAHKKVIIKCNTCNTVFQQAPTDHLNGKGCCICNQSHGERKIRKFLHENKIHFEPEKSFSNCRNPKTNYKLRFDFYVPSKNLLIEFDGRQHFFIGKFGSHIQTRQELTDLQYKDNIKTQYAKNQNIKLLRIPYTKSKNIKTILSQKLL